MRSITLPLASLDCDAGHPRPRLPKVTNLKPAAELSYSLREGIRRVLQNEWFVVVLLFLTASTVRWLFHLQHPRANGFLIYQGAPISDGSLTRSKR